MATGECDRLKWRGIRIVNGINGILPQIDATRINRYTLQTGAGGGVLYTVGANKKLFISSASLSARVSSDTNSYSYLVVREDDDDISYYILYLRLRIAGQLADSCQFMPALEVPEDWDIYIYSSHADVDTVGIIHGWLEDV